MSDFSSRCDLWDHIYSIGCKGTTDEMTEKEMFEVFKKRTGGVLYQNIQVPLTERNFEIEAKKEPYLLRCEKEEVLTPDKRTKEGVRRGYKYHYFYLNEEIKLPKKDYYAKSEIHFNDMLDLVPYYGYIISSMASDPDGETVFIASRSEIDQMRYDALKYGNTESYFVKYCQENIKAETIRLVKEYY